MHFEPFELLIYFLPLLGSLIVFYFLGYLLFRYSLKNELTANNYVNAFLKTFFGMLLSISLYAFFKTSFNTVFIAIIFVLLFVVWRKRGKLLFLKNNYNQIEWKELGLLIIFTSVSFAGFLWGWIYNSSADTLNSIFDFHFYAQVSSFLDFAGKESLRFDFLEPASANNYPYHYGMLWLNSNIAGLTGINHMFSLLLVTMPLLFGLVAFGFASLIATVFPEKKYLPLLGFIIWMIGPFGFIRFNVYTIFSETIGQTISAEPKAIFVYLFFIAAIIFYLLRRQITSLVFLILMPIFYLPVLPVVYTTVSITLFFLTWKKKMPVKEMVSLIGCMLGVALFIIGFYFLQKGGLNASMFQTENSVTTLSSYVRGMVGSFLRLTLLLFTTLSPFIILAVFTASRYIKSGRKFTSEPFIFGTLLFVVAGFCYAVFYNVVDAEQYFSKSFIPFLIIMLSLLLIYLFQHRIKILGFLSLLIFITAVVYARPFVYNYHNRQHLIVNRPLAENFLSYFRQHKIPVNMAFMNDDCFFSFTYRYNSRTYVPFKYLNYFSDPFIASSLDMPDPSDSISCDKDHNNPYTIENLGTRTFNRFVNAQKDSGSFIAINKSRVDFIRKYNLNCIAWSETVKLDNNIAILIDSSSLLKDDNPNHHGVGYYIARFKNIISVDNK